VTAVSRTFVPGPLSLAVARAAAIALAVHAALRPAVTLATVATVATKLTVAIVAPASSFSVSVNVSPISTLAGVKSSTSGTAAAPPIQ
jgi:2-methylaconitate cis-trans-isomerase PrpF